MPQPTPGLALEYVPCAGGARLVRLFGDTPCPVLPAHVDGLPLAELGDYCFAQEMRETALPPEAALRRYTVPGACAPGGAAHRIGGAFLTSLTLPDSLRVIGSCAFYNCRSLEALALGAAPLALGSDVFLNTFALHTLFLRAAPDAFSPLETLLVSLAGEVRAVFAPGETPLAAAHYPEYWEDIEETPAHILLHAYSGQGYHYRQCFAGGVPRWEEYDAVFPMARAEDSPAVMAALSFDRLRWPFSLGSAAEADYRAFLGAQANAAALLKRLRTAQDTEALRALLALDVLDASALEAGAAEAARADAAPFAALLTDALHCKQAGAHAAACRYTFDF